MYLWWPLRCIIFTWFLAFFYSFALTSSQCIMMWGVIIGPLEQKNHSSECQVQTLICGGKQGPWSWTLQQLYMTIIFLYVKFSVFALGDQQSILFWHCPRDLTKISCSGLLLALNSNQSVIIIRRKKKDLPLTYVRFCDKCGQEQTSLDRGQTGADRHGIEVKKPNCQKLTS